ncbi:MAG: metallophosphoesterase [Oscillospiraceae bacterium]|jgi:3',5'-cyclic AMP phosphodiesterase CpdA|nr:metallophosphoesterase [Oscillospiraceae bacterium]
MAEKFIPVLRFVAVSDVHYQDRHTPQRERMAKALQIAYREAAAHPDYQSLDALCVVGDLADNGTETQFAAFRQTLEEELHPGTQAILSVASHEFGNAGVEAAYEKMRRILRQEPDVHAVINGFHFISITPSEGTSFNEGKQIWAAKQLQNAAADDPTGRRPIFFFQHPHIRDTVAGSLDWGNADLTAILMHYPQVVDFSGHSHVPVNDPRSIHQEYFTCLGTGTLYYFDLDEYDKYYGTTPPGAQNAAQMLLIEADAVGHVRVQPYNVLNDEPYPYLWKIDTFEPTQFPYTRKKRRAAAQKPAFAPQAKITYNKGTLEFDQAQSGDSDPVNDYILRVRNAKGRIVRQLSLWAAYYFAPMPPTLQLELEGLTPGAAYTVEITARGFWENVGDPPLVGRFIA